MGLFSHKEYNFDFTGRKKLWYIIALAFIVPGLLVMLFAGFNEGIEFTGGSVLEIQYDADVDLADVRDIVESCVTQTPSVNASGDNTFIIRTEELEEDEMDAMQSALKALGSFAVQRDNRIGPTIGSELLSNARWALLIAGILMLGYITIRFKFNYAVTAIAALAHDALVMCSIFAIFRIEVDSSFIAAVLTIVGYSINNTIVIFDRIRENSGYKGKMSRTEMINKSINQTLGRTINTELAVLFLLFALLIFGGETTKHFILALTVGMFAGFFSSVFLVGNVLDDLTKRLSVNLGGDKKPVAKKVEPQKKAVTKK